MMQLLLTEFASCRHQNKVPGFLKNRGFLISFYMHFVATAVCICNSMTPLLVYLSFYSLEQSTWCTVSNTTMKLESCSTLILSVFPPEVIL